MRQYKQIQGVMIVSCTKLLQHLNTCAYDNTFEGTFKHDALLQPCDSLVCDAAMLSSFYIYLTSRSKRDIRGSANTTYYRSTKIQIRRGASLNANYGRLGEIK